METAVDRILAQFMDGGWVFVEALPSTESYETTYIDFKLSESADGQLRKSDRKNLSKALSGFANSDGGLIVWGIDAEPDEDGYDKVIAVHPIRNLHRFVSTLNSVEPQSVSPLVPGVQHIPIASLANSDVGIAITVVPSSDATPHMATGKDLHCYFRRSGSSFMPMQHHEVADLFGRRPHPELELAPTWRVRRAATRGGTTIAANLELHLRILNRGRGSARFTSLSLSEPKGLEADRTGGYEILASSLRVVRSAQHWWVRVAATSEDLVYPQDEMYVGYVRFRLAKDRRSYPDVSMQYSLICDGSPAQAGTLKVPGDSVAAAAKQVFEGQADRIKLAS